MKNLLINFIVFFITLFGILWGMSMPPVDFVINFYLSAGGGLLLALLFLFIKRHNNGH